jgi:hypothetical protein
VAAGMVERGAALAAGEGTGRVLILHLQLCSCRITNRANVAMNKRGDYVPRIADSPIDELLTTFPAVRRGKRALVCSTYPKTS